MATPFDIIRGTDEPLVRTNAYGNRRFNLVVGGIVGSVHRPYLGDLPDSTFPFKLKRTPTRMNITNQIYMGAEAAMSNALAGVSRPNGVNRLCIVLCAPLLLAVWFYVRRYVF